MPARSTPLAALPLAALSLAVAPGASPVGSTQLGIIHGDAYLGSEQPSAAQLIISGSVQGQAIAAPICTAVLIGPDVVLTAAHCLSDLPITFGIFELEDMTFHISFEEDLTWMNEQANDGGADLPDDALTGSGFVLHEGFDVDELQADGTLREQFDIGLVFLEEPTDREHAWVIGADEADLLEEGLEVEIVGYGQRTPERQGFPPDPDATALRHGGLSWINLLGEAEFQVGGDEDSTRKCHGDSGGPSYAAIGDGAHPFRVVGVTSRAFADRDCLEGGVDTRVDHYLDWIDEEMRRACDDGLRTDCAEPGLRSPAADDGDDDDDDDGGQGCEQQGCASVADGSGAGALGLLLVLGASARRRRLQ